MPSWSHHLLSSDPLFTLVGVFVCAAGISVLVHLVACWLFPRWGFLDFPERYGLRRPRLPYPIGLVFAVLAVATFVFTGPVLEVSDAALVTVLALLTVLCLADDRLRVPVWLRLSAQVVIAFFLFAYGTRIYTMQNPLSFLTGDAIIPLDQLTLNTTMFGSLPLWSGLVTIAWLLLTMNAMNWFDGIPGQVSVLSVIAFFTMGLLALLPNVEQPNVGLLCFIFSGLAAGSAFVTFPQPKAILGDTGAMTMGLLIGILAMAAGGKVATAFLVLGVPLIDSFLVIVRRILKGNAPWKGSAQGEHLHHRLLHKGWSEHQIILLTIILGFSFGGSALVFSTTGKMIALMVLTLVMIGLSIYSGSTENKQSL